VSLQVHLHVHPHLHLACEPLCLALAPRPCRKADLQRLDILINTEAVDALARIVHRDKAQAVGRRLCTKLRVGGCRPLPLLLTPLLVLAGKAPHSHLISSIQSSYNAQTAN
jgi:hypothetical protein